MIAIYRHMKLAFAAHKPDPAYRIPPVAITEFTGPEVSLNLGKGYLPGPTELTFMRRTSPTDFRKLMWHFSKGQFITMEYTNKGTVQTWPKKELIPPLVNMVWTSNNQSEQVFNMLDLMSNRCLIETHMHAYHGDWKDFVVLEINFNRKRDLTTPFMAINEIRPLADVEIARATEPNPESADEWIKLFMGDKP